MIKIIGVGPRWLAVAGAVVLAAAAACQSAPDHGLASPATAPATAPATTPDTEKAAPPADRAAVEPAAPPSTAAAPTTGDSGKAPPQPIPPALPRCHTADLALEVGQSDSATSHTGLNLALVNRSTHRCRIYGYGGIQLLDAAGAALPTHQDRGHPTPTLLTLRPGDRAYSALLWISNTDAVPCFAASALQVIPPDETEPIRAPFTHTVCGNGVVGQGAYRSDPT
jgi:Domain of unknown function (DUF4232)